MTTGLGTALHKDKATFVSSFFTTNTIQTHQKEYSIHTVYRDKEMNLKFSGFCVHQYYRGADKSLAQPGKKQATATEDFEFHISYL